MPSFTIVTPKGPRAIGPGNPCFIVAEMSGNHNQNYDKAVEIVKAAAGAGADAIKLQTYTPDTMTIDCDKEWFMVRGKDQPDLWKGQKLYDLYKTAYTPWEWDAPLKKISEDLGLAFFSTPFDPTAVDFLERLDVMYYKVASYEATDLFTLRAVARTGKPVILSTGFATEDEVAWAVETLRSSGARYIALLHCVTAYSDEPNIDEMNLATMRDMAKKFGVVVGFSDNNAGIEVPVAATRLGASVIEKHMILDRNEGGPDARFSVTPGELAAMVQQIRAGVAAEPSRMARMEGVVHYGCQSDQERQNMFFRRSLFVVKDMKRREAFTPENVRSIRPSAGLPTRHYDDIIGKTSARDIPRGTPLGWELIA